MDVLNQEIAWIQQNYFPQFQDLFVIYEGWFLMRVDVILYVFLSCVLAVTPGFPLLSILDSPGSYTGNVCNAVVFGVFL